MGRHQRAESVGLISFVLCAAVAYAGMTIYLQFAPAFWQLSQRRFMACAGFVAGCGVISFIVGYIHRSIVVHLTPTPLLRIRRIIEILALSVVYAATLFLTSFTLFNILNDAMGTVLFSIYIAPLCAGFAGIAGYITYVQAELMDAKTLASLLPLFIIAGVCTASLTTTDPDWFHYNFSALGDRTTFGAQMFNTTLILGGICIIIVSYFALSELLATYEVQDADGTVHLRQVHRSYRLPNLRLRLILLAIFLVYSGIAFIGIGTFRYTPHPILHNVFARSVPVVMSIMFVSLPWLAPQLSRAFYVASDLAVAVAGIEALTWLFGNNTLTNVEALAAMIYLGWFVVFARQIAAIEADRIQKQLLAQQTANTEELQQILEQSEPSNFNTVLYDRSAQLLAEGREALRQEAHKHTTETPAQ